MKSFTRWSHGVRGLVVAGALALAASSCVRGGVGGSGYRGAINVRNESGLRVCGLYPESMGSSGSHDGTSDEIAPNATGTLNATRGFNRIQIVECETNRLLYGDPLAWLNDQQTHSGPLSAGQITLLAPGTTPPSGDSGWSIVLDPLDAGTAIHHIGAAGLGRQGLTGDETFMNDSALAGQALDLLRSAARRAGWSERYTSAMIISDDWSTIQERSVGYAASTMVTVARSVMFVAYARTSSNFCFARSQGLVQPYDGSSETGPVRLGGVGTTMQVPCALLDAAESAPGASTGS